MNKIYSTDECNDLTLFLKEIKKYQKEGKIEWTKIDIETYKILDLDLCDSEIRDIKNLFDKLDVYEIGEVEDDELDTYFDDEEDDDYSGYSKKKYNSDDDF